MDSGTIKSYKPNKKFNAALRDYDNGDTSTLRAFIANDKDVKTLSEYSIHDAFSSIYDNDPQLAIELVKRALLLNPSDGEVIQKVSCLAGACLNDEVYDLLAAAARQHSADLYTQLQYFDTQHLMEAVLHKAPLSQKAHERLMACDKIYNSKLQVFFTAVSLTMDDDGLALEHRTYDQQGAVSLMKVVNDAGFNFEDPILKSDPAVSETLAKMFGRKRKFRSALELMFKLHDEGMADIVLLDAMITLGADVNRVLDLNPLLSDEIWDMLDQHPRLRSEALSEIAQNSTSQTDTPAVRSKPSL